MADDIVDRLRNTDYEYEDAELAFAAADEIDRLRAAGDVLADWALIDHSPEQCEEGCEYLEALLAWREARRG